MEQAKGLYLTGIVILILAVLISVLAGLVLAYRGKRLRKTLEAEYGENPAVRAKEKLCRK